MFLVARPWVWTSLLDLYLLFVSSLRLSSATRSCYYCDIGSEYCFSKLEVGFGRLLYALYFFVVLFLSQNGYGVWQEIWICWFPSPIFSGRSLMVKLIKQKLQWQFEICWRWSGNRNSWFWSTRWTLGGFRPGSEVLREKTSHLWKHIRAGQLWHCCGLIDSIPWLLRLWMCSAFLSLLSEQVLKTRWADQVIEASKWFKSFFNDHNRHPSICHVLNTLRFEFRLWQID